MELPVRPCFYYPQHHEAKYLEALSPNFNQTKPTSTTRIINLVFCVIRYFVYIIIDFY